MLDLNNYINNEEDNKAKLFHTSGHAQIGRGAQIGSAGGQSFEQRLGLAGQSRTIHGYQRSLVGSRHGALRAKRFTPPTQDRKDKNASSGRQAFNAGDKTGGGTPSRPSGFREPPSRGYNPYS